MYTTAAAIVLLAEQQLLTASWHARVRCRETECVLYGAVARCAGV